jgi:hypothetical protein
MFMVAYQEPGNPSYFFLVGHQKPSLVLDSNLMNMDLKHCFKQVLEPQLFRVKCSPWYTSKKQENFYVHNMFFIGIPG